MCEEFNMNYNLKVFFYLNYFNAYIKPISKSVFLYLSLDFAPIMIEKLPEAVNLTENDKLTLKAKVGGKPMPSVKW